MAAKTRLIGFAWGFCEATFFFLVPDIWLSRVVLADRREAYLNIAFTALGALLGGCVMYFLAMASFGIVQKFLDLVPGISAPMIEETGRRIQELGLWEALLSGAASGVPYKIYASWSGHLELSLAAFLLASALVRMLRFAAVTALVHVLSLALEFRLNRKQLFGLHALGWTGFYIFYFYTFGFW